MGAKTTARAFVVASLGIIGVIAFPVPMFAHHGTGTSYDQDKTIQVRGKVTEFWWKNPHAALFMVVTDGPFKGRNYAVELNSPGVMIRQGWTLKQFQFGDEVVMNVHPSKTGASVGECLRCTIIVNGKGTKPR